MGRPFRCGALVLATCMVGGGPLLAGEDRTGQASEFVALLARGELAAAVATFDDTMKSALPEAKLREVWTMLQSQAGAFQKQERTRRETAGSYDVVFVTCRFERGLVDAKVVYDSAGRVAGLFFLPPAPETPWQPPAYCRAGTFEDRDLTVGSGEWALPGTLSVPSMPGPHPALVLVHGSGPQDRDETIGANKPFADLACGLASRGVAVLRYEKRTRQYASRLASANAALTVKDETVDDAAAAARLVRTTAGIDARRVFVLGHSLGGMLVPRIAQAAPELRGLVVMAGTTRPLEDVMVEQLAYISSLPETSDAGRKQIAAMQAALAQVKALPASKAGSPEPVMGVPASYWLDLRGYRPAEAARAVKQPMLLLQGGRDYQVTTADFQNWKDALGSRPDATLKLYPDLNHLFVAGEGRSVPSEYQKPGHVAEVVVTDIAGWILRLGSEGK
ncbi:MAG TPA: alpha/beta fold hydrolase [Vicinamibacteria bacterium]|nr:alpha/beta fold hydrolase [Vicinamibacteria bacterium]